MQIFGQLYFQQKVKAADRPEIDKPHEKKREGKQL